MMKNICLVMLVLGVLGNVQAQEWVSYESQRMINDFVDTGDELHLATDIGLVVVNKTTLATSFFNTYNSNLPSNHIQTVSQGLNGNTWIGTYDLRVAEFDGDDFEETPVPQSLVNNPNTINLYDVKFAQNGDLWLGTTEGVFHRQSNDWIRYDEDEFGSDYFATWDLALDESGDVFMAANHIFKFSNGAWTNISDGTNLIGYLGAYISFDSTGDLYFAGDLDKIGRYNGQTWDELGFGLPINGSEVGAFTEDMNGELYFSTKQDGIFRLVNDTWQQESDAQAAAFNNRTDFFYIDADGRRWMSNNIHLSVNDNGNIQTTLIAPHTLEYSNTYDVHHGDNGKMYFLTASFENVSVRDMDGNWSFLPAPNSSVIENYLDIRVLADDNIWLTSSLGVHHFDGSDWTFFDTGYSSGLYSDSQGKIYVMVANFSQIYMIENGIINEYNAMNSPLPDTYISGMGVDANDNLWIGLGEQNMVMRVTSSGNWTSYGQADYPGLDCSTRGDFHFDASGNVWVPSDCFGAFRFDGTTFTNPYAGISGSVDDINVHSIESDASGKMYFSHTFGVVTELNGAIENLPIDALPMGSSSSSVIDFDGEGTLWFGNSRFGTFALETDMTSSQSNTIIGTIVPLTVYPNPTSDQAMIEFDLEENAAVQLFIYNNLGQAIRTKNLGRLSNGLHQDRLDVSQWPKGIYTIQLRIDKQTTVKRLVVN